MTTEGSGWLDGIDGDAARLLISSDERVIRVVAGPGAGKTTCLKRRIRRLIESGKTHIDRIFVGTFTRAIANELRAELGEDIRVNTLHSFAYELLRQHPAARQGFELRFLVGYEQDAMLYDVASEVPHLDSQNKRQEALRRLQSARAERRELPDAAFAGAIHRWLRRHGGMLIGEVVFLVVQGLEAEDIPPGQFDHVVVDEYQDLTAAEQELVERVWSRSGSLVVLGDNNQSIYAFRFNHPDGINEFADRWSGSGLYDVTIDENRRSAPEIVDLANQMMAEGGSTMPPMLPTKEEAGVVSAIQWPSLDEEIAGIAAMVNARQSESFLILVPRRFIGYRLQDAIPDARTSFREQVLESPVAQERFAAASVVADPDDLVSVRAWLGFHASRQELGNRRNAGAYASLPEAMSGRELITALATGDVVPHGDGALSVVARARMLSEMLDACAPMTVEEQLNYFFNPALADVTDLDEEHKNWLRRDLTALHSAASRLVDTEGDLESVLSTLRYRIATRSPLGEEDEDKSDVRVRIMTLHSAKGLEARNIVVVGAADQLMPGLAETDAERSEQHRLLYVAITRARSDLVLSWPRAVKYADARKNSIRIDAGSVQTVDAERVVKLTRSTLLPQALAGIQAGHSWARQNGYE